MASIVVVGGGLAGLACAWKLRRAGHDVELLERRRAASGDGTPSQAEDAWLRASDGDVIAAAAALEIPWRAGSAQADAYPCGERFAELPSLTLPALLAEPGGSPMRRLRWARSVLARAIREGSRSRSLAARDGASFEAVIAGALGEDPLAPRLAALAGLACCEAPARLSSASGLAALAAHAVDPRPIRLEGGLVRLRSELTQAVKVRWGCEVVDLVTESAGARVRYRTQGRLRTVLADAAVVALPPSELLGSCPKLTPDERGFFESVESAPQTAVRLTLDRSPAGFPWHRVCFPAPEATLRSLVMTPAASGAARSGQAVLEAELAAEPAGRLVSAADADVEAVVLDALFRTPLRNLRPAELVVMRGVSPRPLFPPGAVERIARFDRRMERSPRLAFAGRHLLAPGPAAAFTSGLRAATAIARGL